MLVLAVRKKVVMMTMNCKLVGVFVVTFFIMESVKYDTIILDVDAFDNYERIITMGEVEQRHYLDL